jgi:hypothetical protein
MHCFLLGEYSVAFSATAEFSRPPSPRGATTQGAWPEHAGFRLVLTTCPIQTASFISILFVGETREQVVFLSQ